MHLDPRLTALRFTTGARAKAWCLLIHAEASLSLSRCASFHRLKPQYYEPLLNFAFKSNLRRYAEAGVIAFNDHMVENVKPEMRALNLALSLGVGAFAAAECAKSFKK